MWRIYKGESAYVFIASVKAPASLETQDENFVKVINSFRPLRAEERKLAQPLRLQLVRATSAQTMTKLAQGSTLPGNAESRLRLLNHLYPSGEPSPGDWLKVVR